MLKWGAHCHERAGVFYNYLWSSPAQSFLDHCPAILMTIFYSQTRYSTKLKGHFPHNYFPYEQGGLVMPTGNGFSSSPHTTRKAAVELFETASTRTHRLAENWSWSHVTTDSQYVLVSSPLWDLRPDILSEIFWLVSVGLPLWREVGCGSCQSLSAVIVHHPIFSFSFSPRITCWPKTPVGPLYISTARTAQKTPLPRVSLFLCRHSSPWKRVCQAVEMCLLCLCLGSDCISCYLYRHLVTIYQVNLNVSFPIDS
jgi:hypothetical protein